MASQKVHFVFRLQLPSPRRFHGSSQDSDVAAWAFGSVHVSLLGVLGNPLVLRANGKPKLRTSKSPLKTTSKRQLQINKLELGRFRIFFFSGEKKQKQSPHSPSRANYGSSPKKRHASPNSRTNRIIAQAPPRGSGVW